MIHPLFTQFNEDLGNRLNAGSPADDFATYGEVVSEAIAGVVGANGTSEDPQGYGVKVAHRFFPNILPYQVGTEATFGFAEWNGRSLTDNAPDVMFRVRGKYSCWSWYRRGIGHREALEGLPVRAFCSLSAKSYRDTSCPLTCAQDVLFAPAMTPVAQLAKARLGPALEADRCRREITRQHTGFARRSVGRRGGRDLWLADWEVSCQQCLGHSTRFDTPLAIIAARAGLAIIAARAGLLCSAEQDLLRRVDQFAISISLALILPTGLGQPTSYAQA